MIVPGGSSFTGTAAIVGVREWVGRGVGAGVGIAVGAVAGVAADIAVGVARLASGRDGPDVWAPVPVQAERTNPATTIAAR